MLKRKFYDTLLKWKVSHGRECLFVKGARQIGKTFIIDYFGRENYFSYVYLNFIANRGDAPSIERANRSSSIFPTSEF